MSKKWTLFTLSGNIKESNGSIFLLLSRQLKSELHFYIQLPSELSSFPLLYTHLDRTINTQKKHGPLYF
jgi:hypothetical protein